jgi:hypothetical protein
MFPSEYDLHERRKELLRQAEQHRLARQFRTTLMTPMQRAGQSLLKIGARLAAKDTEACQAVESSGKTIMVCPA